MISPFASLAAASDASPFSEAASESAAAVVSAAFEPPQPAIVSAIAAAIAAAVPLFAIIPNPFIFLIILSLSAILALADFDSQQNIKSPAQTNSCAGDE